MNCSPQGSSQGSKCIWLQEGKDSRAWNHWNQDSHAVKRTVAGTATSGASPKKDPAWEERGPHPVPRTPTSKAGSSNIAQKKRMSNQQCANVNVARAGARRLKKAIRKSGCFSNFDYEGWMKSADGWNYEIYMEKYAQREADAKQVAKQLAKQGAKLGLKAKAKAKAKGRMAERELREFTLPMTRVYFDQVRKGFDIAMYRLRNKQGVYTDDPPVDYDEELKGDFMGSFVTVLPHVTSDEDWRNCPPPKDSTDREPLDNELVELVIDQCVRVECDPEVAPPRASDEFRSLPFTFRDALDQSRKGHNLSPIAVTAAAEKLDPLSENMEWQKHCREIADDYWRHYLYKDEFWERCFVLTQAVEKHRDFRVKHCQKPCSECLAYLSEQIVKQITGRSGQIEVLTFGSCRYHLCVEMSDCDFLIVLHNCAVSRKEFLKALVTLMKSEEGKEYGFSSVTGASLNVSRGTIQPRFRGKEYDICCCHATAENHCQTRTTVFLDELLITLQGKYGYWIRHALVLFKLICYGGRWSARHKERRNTFKSITLIMWAYCQIDALATEWIPQPDKGSLEKARPDETHRLWCQTAVPWVVTFLVHAFVHFPWEELVVHIEKDKQTSIRLRSDPVYNTYAKHGACIMFEPEPGNATNLTKAQLKAALVRAHRYFDEYGGMAGYHPSDSRPNWVGVWRVPCRQLYFCPSG